MKAFLVLTQIMKNKLSIPIKRYFKQEILIKLLFSSIRLCYPYQLCLPYTVLITPVFLTTAKKLSFPINKKLMYTMAIDNILLLLVLVFQLNVQIQHCTSLGDILQNSNKHNAKTSKQCIFYMIMQAVICECKRSSKSIHV